MTFQTSGARIEGVSGYAWAMVSAGESRMLNRTEGTQALDHVF